MNSGCVANIGDMNNGGVSFSNDQILACSFIENLSNLPNGRIIIKMPSLGLDEVINLPSGVAISITLASFEDPDDIPDETKVVINGTVLKHYSSSLDSQGGSFNIHSTYVIEFIVAGPSLSYLQLLKGQAILSNSLGAIKKIGKLAKANILFDDSSIKTQDAMKWLIVNRNLVTAIDMITNRSYLSEDDVLFSCHKLDGSIRIGSIKTSYNNSKKIGYVYGNSKFDILNTPLEINGISQLTYGAFDISHSSAIKQSNASAGITRLKLPLNGKNNKESKSQGVMPTGTNVEGDNKVNGNVSSVVYRKDVYIHSHPNTHDYYDIAPLIRDAVFSNFSHQINIVASGENIVNVGDFIDVLIPTSGTQSSGSGEVLYSKVLSGKYFVYSKLYQFGNGNRFTVVLSLMKSDINYDPKNYFDQFGIDPKRVK